MRHGAAGGLRTYVWCRFFLTPEVLAEAEAILIRAERAVAGTEEVYRERVKLIRIGFEHGKLMSEVFFTAALG